VKSLSGASDVRMRLKMATGKPIVELETDAELSQMVYFVVEREMQWGL
jgi:hypothetical protein